MKMNRIEETIGQSDSGDNAIAITRVVEAGPDEVFEAWLRQEHLSHWWGPREAGRDFSTPHVEVDPRPGGLFRTCIRSPQGAEYWARGVFREIDSPRRLVFTHGWESEDGKVDEERLVTVDFTGTGDNTRVSFRIGGYASADSLDCEIEGWHECLDRLVLYFAGRQASTSGNEAEIREIIRAWSKALEAKDLDGMMAGYARDVVLFDAIPPYRTSGVEAFRAAWEQCFPYLPDKFDSEHRDLKITVGGNLAFVHGLHRFKPVDKDHPAGKTWVRVTVCFRKVEGKWLVEHEHVSIPFDPISGKAVFIENVE